MIPSQYEEITKNREHTVRRENYKILESYACEKTGAGVILGEGGYGESKIAAHYFKPRTHRRSFDTEVISSSHQRINLQQRLKDIIQAEKDAKKAPHDLKVGEIVCTIWGVTMQGVRFYKVVDIPSPRKVSIASIDSRMVSGDWMGGQVEPLVDDVPQPDATTHMVDMSTGRPMIKCGSSISRTTRWSGKPVDIYSD